MRLFVLTPDNNSPLTHIWDYFFSYTVSNWFNKWSGIPIDQSAGSSHGVNASYFLWQLHMTAWIMAIDMASAQIRYKHFTSFIELQYPLLRYLTRPFLTSWLILGQWLVRFFVCLFVFVPPPPYISFDGLEVYN